MSVTRLALVGAGRIGRMHARAIEASDRLQLAAVAEPLDEAAAALPGAAALRVRDVPELLRRGGFDAAVVAAPSSRHLEIASALAEAGIPTLCEKPCGLSSHETCAAREAFAAAGVPAQVGYWRRYVPRLRGLRERLARGELGRVGMVLCAQWDESPPPASFRDPATSGGIVVDMGVHEFDTLRWLTGQEIESFAGLPPTVHYVDDPVAGDADNAPLLALLSRGTVGVITLTRSHPAGDLCRVEVLAEHATETVEYLAPPRSEAQLVDALRRQAEGFAASLDGKPDGATLDDAVSALDAAERAAATLWPRDEDSSAPTAEPQWVR